MLWPGLGKEARKPYEFLGFGTMHLVFFAVASVGVHALHATKPYEFLGLAEIHCVFVLEPDSA